MVLQIDEPACRHDLKTPECQQRVKEIMELASRDIRAAVPLQHACSADREKFCASVQPGSARVIRCLQARWARPQSLGLACTGCKPPCTSPVTLYPAPKAGLAPHSKGL